MIRVPSREGVKKTLTGLYSAHRAPHAVLKRLLAYLPEGAPAVGAGDPLTTLQRRVAALLGKEAAVFFPTGKMAQQVALRVHADNTGRKTFAAHPTCHVVNWELDGYAIVHGLRFCGLGDRNRLFTESDIRAACEPLSTVLWELPQREMGGFLPAWDDLCGQVAAARSLGAKLHLDGARIWESQPGLGRPFPEIAALFDSVYVSLYKTLEVPRGALLAGSAGFIAQATTWLTRLGGEAAGNWPAGAIGLMALDQILPRMNLFWERAIALAAAINGTGVARTVPLIPQTPLFHVRLPIRPESAVDAHVRLCEETGLEVFSSVRTSDDPAACIFEISVGEGAMEIAPREVAEFLVKLVEIGRGLKA